MSRLYKGRASGWRVAGGGWWSIAINVGISSERLHFEGKRFCEFMS